MTNYQSLNDKIHGLWQHPDCSDFSINILCCSVYVIFPVLYKNQVYILLILTYILILFIAEVYATHRMNNFYTPSRAYSKRLQQDVDAE